MGSRRYEVMAAFWHFFFQAGNFEGTADVQD